MTIKISRYIRPEIRRALLVFSVILLSMATIIVLSQTYMLGDQRSYRKTEMEIRKWKSRIDQANTNNQILVDHENDFYRLKDKAVIGDENRLSWVEVIQRVADQRGLVSVKYNISSQQLDTHENLKTDFAGIDVFRSVMSLDMKLMHEGDFFMVMDALRNEAKGLFIVDKCDMELLNSNLIAGSAMQENIRATCELSWYTMKKSGEG